MPAHCTSGATGRQGSSSKYSHEDGSTERAAALRTAWEYATEPQEPTTELGEAWARYVRSNTLDASERDLRHVDRMRDALPRR